jgi:hypothetical protein
MDPYLLAQHAELDATHWWIVGRKRILARILDRWLPDFDVRLGRINTLLTGLSSAERHIMTRAPLPFGVSIAAVARRPDRH